MTAADEAQAAAYRAQLRQRIRAERERLRSLRGDAAAAQAVRDNWQPVLDAIREERRYGSQEESN